MLNVSSAVRDILRHVNGKSLLVANKHVVCFTDRFTHVQCFVDGRSDEMKQKGWMIAVNRMAELGSQM